jgi:hypothetical protein
MTASSEKETTPKAASVEVGGINKVSNLTSRVAIQVWKHGSQKRSKTLCTATPAVILVNQVVQ